MKKELDCALSSFPKDLLKEVLNEQIRIRIKSILERQGIRDIIDETVRKVADPLIISLVTVETQKYINKNKTRILESSISDYEISDDILEKIQNEFDKFISKKLKI